MRKFASPLAVVVCGVAVATFVYSRYRVLPLGPVPKHRAIIVSASSPDCAIPVERSNRAIVLQTNPGLATVQINREHLQITDLGSRLANILFDRLDHTIFLFDKSRMDGHLSLWLEKVLEQEPMVNRICVIDPIHPPIWWPPKYLAGGGAGSSEAGQYDRKVREPGANTQSISD
jgi:hypothetical protein